MASLDEEDDGTTNDRQPLVSAVSNPMLKKRNDNNNNGMDIDEAEIASPEGGAKEKERLRKLDVWRLENVALPVFYFMLGFNLKLPFVAQRQYLRRVLKASPANQALVLSVIAQIPWQLKLFYAFLSDSVPIQGQRRRPYMFIGVIIFTISWMLLGAIRPAPGIGWTSVLLFAGCFGMIMTDVMADTLVVEKVALERGKGIGSTQTLVWTLRFTGSFFGQLAGGWLMQYAKLSEQNIFLLQGFTQVVTVFPLLFYLEDQIVDSVQDVRKQIDDIWLTIQDYRVNFLIFFMFIVGSTPNAGSAFTNFLLGPLKFTDEQYMYIGTVGIVCSAGGIWLYRQYFRNTNLRVFVFVILLLSAALQLVPLILVSRLNLKWGISDFWFSIGDEVVVEFVGILVVMPMLIVCAKVSPANVEGTIYSFLTMSSNISMAIGESFSALLTAGLGISVTNFRNLWLLIVISAITSIIPGYFVQLLPNTIEKTKRIKIMPGEELEYKSFWAGIMALILIGGGLFWSIVLSIAKIASNNK